MTSARSVQFKNAHSPMVLTLLGSVTSLRYVQSANASFPIDSILSERVTVVNAEQPEKAEGPIDVTLAGIVISASLVHWANNPLLIDVMPSGSVTDFSSEH